jgi:NAD(P)H-dependent FMN reductase
MSKKKILAISGSTRAESTNLKLIRAIGVLSSAFFEITIYNDLASLPHFNPDHDKETSVPNKAVANLRRLISEADGVLICTPEYAMGVPGSLKNAIDWTVSSAEFSHKPTALITASSLGQKGHASLIETLKIIEAKITEETQLLIPFIKTKMSGEIISDNKTKGEVHELLKNLDRLID